MSEIILPKTVKMHVVRAEIELEHFAPKHRVINYEAIMGEGYLRGAFNPPPGCIVQELFFETHEKQAPTDKRAETSRPPSRLGR